ncbi:MAG: stage V sporulation protein AD [Clostridiales bacterium]|nr:stage V sporulation protein AD [Clostridiales bacterium]
MNRLERYTLKLSGCTGIIGYAAVGGKTEGEGPLAGEFDYIYPDDGIGQPTWEQAESELHRDAVMRAVKKSGKIAEDIDMIFAGDLLDQCTGSTFGIKDMNIPFHGVYGACSTMALALATASVFADCGAANTAVASTSSHFCSAEKQFRFPLEYGGQRTPTAQRTATAAGAAVVASGQTGGILVDKVIYGRVKDLGVTDANNMGAAMAPAASCTIKDFLTDTDTTPADYDMILTGDLGAVGSELLLELLKTRENIDISAVHNDCGKMLFDIEKQDVHAGGSGCGCSASVLCSHIFNRMKRGEIKNLLFVATGALMSPTSALQNQSIPGIAHGVNLIYR